MNIFKYVIIAVVMGSAFAAPSYANSSPLCLTALQMYSNGWHDGIKGTKLTQVLNSEITTIQTIALKSGYQFKSQDSEARAMFVFGSIYMAAYLTGATNKGEIPFTQSAAKFMVQIGCGTKE